MSNEVKSCMNCTNRLGSNSSVAVFGSPIPVVGCRAIGRVVSVDTMSAEEQIKSMEDFASDCTSYNKDISVSDQTDRLRIGIFSSAATMDTDVSGANGKAGSCRACYFHIPVGKMIEKTTIPMGACARYGKLIPEQRASMIARGCNSSTRSAVTDPEAHYRGLLDSLVLDPTLERHLFPERNNAVASSDMIDMTVEPSTHPSDRAVTAQQDAQGIRAWRRITMGGRELFIPVFKREIFSAVEAAKIPATGDDEHPETYVDHMQLTFTVAALWFHLDETPSLVGRAGSGKTEFYRYMSWLMQVPFERISITRDSEIDDLAGKMHFENNETVFKPGRIPKAWVKPNVLVLDEPNTGPPEVWQYIRPLTDNSKQLVNDKNEGETISRHPFAFLGLAMNPAWDHRNVGAEQIGDADGSRLMHIYVDMPPESVERSIIVERCKLDQYLIEDDMLETLMRVAKDIRELSDDGTLPITWGVRNQIKVARATAWFDLEKAYRLAVLDYLEPEARETVMEVVLAHSKKKGAVKSGSFTGTINFNPRPR